MRLKRTITEAEFAAAIRYVLRPSKRTLQIAHADLVEGIGQAKIGKQFNLTKGSVSQASKRVWRGFLLSKGYKEVVVVLPQVRAFIAKGWGRESLDELNGGTKNVP